VFAALSAGFDPVKARERAEQEERNAPVPCQWPDTPISAPAADVNDPVQPPSISADQVEYGILCLNLWGLRENVQGHWKARAILEHDSLYTEFDLRSWLILGSGVSGGLGGHATTLRSDISLMAQPCEAVLHLLFECYMDLNQLLGEDVVIDLGLIRLGPFVESCTTRMESYPFKDTTVKIDITVTFSRVHLNIMRENRWQNRWIRQRVYDLGGLELAEATDTDMFYLMPTICVEDYWE